MERIIEICCGSYEDALNAYHGGAKRIELNNALHLGGLTPSLATLKLTKKNTNLKIITMGISTIQSYQSSQIFEAVLGFIIMILNLK